MNSNELQNATAQQKSFLCENGPRIKLVGAQETFLRWVCTCFG